MAYISEIAHYLPENVLSNEHINQEHPEWSADKISSKTGIFNRHISGENEFSSDLGIKAAQKLFKKKNVEKEDIDFLIFCTQSPDFLIPTTACIVQDKLCLNNNIGAIDINMGCSGYLYGLSYANGLILSGQAKNILLITSETYSKLINPEDKSNKTIFGDGATASLISEKPNTLMSGKIQKFSFYTQGSGYDKLMVKNGGIKYKHLTAKDEFDIDGNYIKNDDYLFMDGKSVFQFTSFKVPPFIDRLLILNNLDLDTIDLFIFHQANVFMMNYIRKRCKIPEDKFHVFIKNCGNTVSSSVPLALEDALIKNKIKKGSRVLLAGFGVGLSISGTIIQF
jgi:3-oxoacyl-[acyl-carrier-protein] synthase III